MKPHLWFVRAMSRLIPYRWRAEWKQEWAAELQHRETLSRGELLRRSLGSFWDALAMQPRRLEEEVFQDLKFGARMFAKNKALTLTAVFSLALGIGANTAIFSMVDAVLLKKLPVKNPDELILFEWNGNLGGAINSMTSDRNVLLIQKSGDTFSYRAFEEFRAKNNSLSTVFGFAKPYTVTLIADDKAEIVNGQWVSGNFFSGLGVAAALGRTITPDDDKPSATPPVVISYRYWNRRFALDPSALGKTLAVNNVPFTIVGVSAPDFSGTLQVNDAPDVFLPMALEPTLRSRRSSLTNPHWAWIYIMARTKPGITPAQALGNLQGIFDEVNIEAAKTGVPPRGGDLLPEPEPFRPGSSKLGYFSGSRGLIDNRLTYEQPLLILMILVGVVLIVACANVANLLLSRASTRRKEIAVRLAMGAGRLRLIRQVLTESILLAVCGGACGAVLAYFTKDLLLRWGPWSNPANPITLKLDLRVLAFTAAVSLLTGVVFGLAPAFAATRRNINATMKDTARTLSSGRSYLGKSLLVVQVALSLVLLIGAGLFVRTMHNLHSVAAAYDPGHILQFDIDPSLMNYEYGKVVTILEEMIERIGSMPGVRSATLSTAGTNFGTLNDEASGRKFTAQFQTVRENYFETFGVPLLLGRSFNASDRPGSPPVVVVNETFVHKYFPDVSPIGKMANGEIVGVVRDAKLGRLRQEPNPTIYYPYRQGGGFANGRMAFRVRTDVEPMLLFPAIRDALQKIDSRLPLANARSMTDAINLAYARENMFAGLSTLFGALALILTCVGFYGIMAYSVARRTNEIGVRVALGAKRFDVLRLVMSEGLFLVVVGIGLGVGGALASGRYIESVLFGLAADDGLTIIVAILVMISIAAVAALIPARKASRVDPLTALRYDY